jgi:hypothetical protein
VSQVQILSSRPRKQALSHLIAPQRIRGPTARIRGGYIADPGVQQIGCVTTVRRSTPLAHRRARGRPYRAASTNHQVPALFGNRLAAIRYRESREQAGNGSVECLNQQAATLDGNDRDRNALYVPQLRIGWNAHRYVPLRTDHLGHRAILHDPDSNARGDPRSG